MHYYTKWLILYPQYIYASINRPVRITGEVLRRLIRGRKAGRNHHCWSVFIESCGISLISEILTMNQKASASPWRKSTILNWGELGVVKFCLSTVSHKTAYRLHTASLQTSLIRWADLFLNPNQKGRDLSFESLGCHLSGGIVFLCLEANAV